MIKRALAGLAGASLVLAPTMAAAAPTGSASANPASALSLGNSKAVRAGTPAGKDKLAGGGVFAAVLLAGIAAIPIIAIVKDSDDDSDSN